MSPRPVALIALAVLCPLALAPVRAADPAPNVTHEFKLRFVNETQLTFTNGESAGFTFGGDYRYAWQYTDQERTLVFRELGFTTGTKGGKTVAMVTNRAGATALEGGKVTKQEKYEDMPEAQKKATRELFGSPLCKQKLDGTGKVLTQTVTAGADVKGILEQGGLDNVNLFHPPFPADKDLWQAEVAMNLSGAAAGAFEYKKVAGGKGGQLVKVTGTLKSNEVKTDEFVKKNIKHVAVGTQTYDPNRKNWISGNLEVDTSADLAAGGKVVGTEKSKATITFELVPEKK